MLGIGIGEEIDFARVIRESVTNWTTQYSIKLDMEQAIYEISVRDGKMYGYADNVCAKL